MLHKIQGIVLNYIRYKETSIILKIFTEVERGPMDCIFDGEIG